MYSPISDHGRIGSEGCFSIKYYSDHLAVIQPAIKVDLSQSIEIVSGNRIEMSKALTADLVGIPCSSSGTYGIPVQSVGAMLDAVEAAVEFGSCAPAKVNFSAFFSSIEF